MKIRKLTTNQEQALCKQVIDADQPGPVLRDFRVLLDFLGTQGVKAAGKYNLGGKGVGSQIAKWSSREGAHSVDLCFPFPL